MKLRNYLMVLMVLASVNIYAQTDATAFAYQKPLFDFDYKKTTFKLEGEQLINANRFFRTSILSGYREGVNPINGPFGLAYDVYDGPVSGTRRIVMYNLSIVEMLRGFRINPNMVILEVKDPSKYIYRDEYGDKLTWLRKNGWCYEYIVPAEVLANKTGSDYFDPMTWQAEIRQLFGVKVSREKRSIKALVLVRTSGINKIKSKGINTGANGTIDQYGNLNNIHLMQMNDFLNQTNLPVLVDETGYDGYVDMNLNITNWSDLPALRKALQKYDLDLKEEMRAVKDVMVVREVNQ